MEHAEERVSLKCPALEAETAVLEGIRVTGKHVLRRLSHWAPCWAWAPPLELGHPSLHFQEFCKFIVKQNRYLSFLKIEIRSIRFHCFVSTVDPPCCVSSRCTAQGFSFTYISSFSSSWINICHGVREQEFREAMSCAGQGHPRPTGSQ